MTTPIKCDCCNLARINGVLCHERGCPNAGARLEQGSWIQQFTCFTCGCEADRGTECCSEKE